MRSSFLRVGPKIWNSLPSDMRNLPKSSFRKMIRNKLFEILSKSDALGEQGWRGGENARLPPMWPGFNSRRRSHMWVEFVVWSLLCSERFFSGYSGFLLSPKTNTSKFQFDLERTDTEKRALKLLGASWVNKLQKKNYIKLHYMTILKSLKSCINLNLTSSGTQLNLYSLCKSYFN